MTTTAEMLDARYGRTSSRRSRVIVGLLVALLALGGGAIAWSIVAASLDDIEAETIGYVEGDGEVTVRFSMSGPAEVPIACAIEAQDSSHGVVGFMITEYPASSQTYQEHTVAVPLTAPATTGFVKSCWVTYP